MKSNRLFIVDDEPGICRVLSTLFTRAGWEVMTFNNPAEALKAIPGSDVDVVITDLQMPEMTGVQLLQSLRAGGQNAPVLVITAHGTIASAVEAMRLGAYDYLTKPFDMEAVKLAVERALSHQEQQHYYQEDLSRKKPEPHRLPFLYVGNVHGLGESQIERVRSQARSVGRNGKSYEAEQENKREVPALLGGPGFRFQTAGSEAGQPRSPVEPERH